MNYPDFMRKLLPFLAMTALVVPAAAQQETALDRVQALSPLEMDEVLWLARAVYSESDRANEQELVAWVIRNRVETGFRGTTYRDVVLEPLQFSAFNNPSERRNYILGLDQTDVVPSWMQAVDVSLDVYGARPTGRPFAIDTRHFYSPVSMVGRDAPTWASAGIELSSVALGVDPNRFRFFSGVDAALDNGPPLAAADFAAATASGGSVSQTIANKPSAEEKIDEQRIEQQTRAAERTTTIRRSSRVRRFSGRVARPRRPSRGSRI